MFWILLTFFLLIVIVLDQIGFLQYKTKILNGKIVLKHFLKRKEIKISSISQARTFLKVGYSANEMIQVKIDGGWEDIGRITFLNYKKNLELLKSLKNEKPGLEFSPRLESYFQAGNIRNYHINNKQIYRGLLLIFIFALLILLSFII